MARQIEAEDLTERLLFNPVAVARLFDTLEQQAKWAPPPGDIAVAFVDIERCIDLHRVFFNDPTPTDVMTFPGDPEDEHAGDIAVCVPFAEEAAREEGTTLAFELCLYLVHGWLHLAGLDDRTETEAVQMRSAETQLLRLLEERDAFVDFQLKDA